MRILLVNYRYFISGGPEKSHVQHKADAGSARGMK